MELNSIYPIAYQHCQHKIKCDLVSEDKKRNAKDFEKIERLCDELRVKEAVDRNIEEWRARQRKSESSDSTLHSE